MEEYLDLELYCCPRCGTVTDDPTGWECVIVDDETGLIDTVCPDDVSDYDLDRPELAMRLVEVDTELRCILGETLS